jgi:hypothetical protein
VCIPIFTYTQPPPLSGALLHQSGNLVTIKHPLIHCYHPKSITYIAFTHSSCTFLWVFEKCIVTRIHHYSIIQNSFTAIKILWALPVHPSLSSNPWQPPILYLFLILSFPQCHIVEIMWWDFPNWLFSLFFFTVPGFELRVLHFLSRLPTTWAATPVYCHCFLFCFFAFQLYEVLLCL